jgi:hypothetical protein
MHIGSGRQRALMVEIPARGCSVGVAQDQYSDSTLTVKSEPLETYDRKSIATGRN